MLTQYQHLLQTYCGYESSGDKNSVSGLLANG